MEGEFLAYFTAEAGDALTGGQTTIGTKIFDTGQTHPSLGVGTQPVYLNIICVAAAGGAGTVQFKLRCSATQSGAALNGTVKERLLTPAYTVGQETNIDTAGKYILRCTIPFEMNLRYWDMVAISTSSATITWIGKLTGMPKSDKGEEVFVSNVGTP